MSGLLAMSAAASADNAHAQIVTVEQGALQGKTEAGVTSFLGIPYASPPVGDLRWRPPQSPQPWTGIKNAQSFGPSCSQEIINGGRAPWSHEYLVSGRVSEDCLFVNVWKPAATAGQKLPVLFWIHGGAFVEGSGSVPIYDGTALAKRGIIVVSVNYRLGALGFLAHPELTKEAGTSGNYGTLDTIAALNWIQRNISAFGGDRASVTVAGQSAGALSVHNLVASPFAKGLFARAIAQSGSGMGLPLKSLADAEKDGVRFAQTDGAMTLAALRAVPADEILRRTSGGPLLRFSPVVDGKYIPREPSSPSPAQNLTPFLTGMTAEEGSTTPGYGSATREKFSATIDTMFGNLAPKARAIYRAKTDAEASRAAKQISSDRGFAGMMLWANQRSQVSTQPLYVYRFEHVEPGRESKRWGSFHSSEIPYVFGTLDKAPERGFAKRDREISWLLGTYWVNFVKTGNPNGAGAPKWASYSAAQPDMLVIENTFSVQPILPSLKAELYKAHAANGGRLSIF